MDVRTRIAPSPTGYPHIGTIYQALFDWAWAKKNSGQFVVRIEDTDRARFVEGAEDIIFASLDWFGLSENESPRRGGSCDPYRQSERLELYHKYVQELIEKEHAYFAYYPKQEAGKKDYIREKEAQVASYGTSANDNSHNGLNSQPPKSVAEMIESGDWVVRMKIPKDQKIVVRDEIRGEIEFDSNQVTEQVLLKSDGFPTYHLAVVVDDHLMEITDVIRGEEWITSFPKHKLLYDYFNWQAPKFYHTPVLRNPDHSKLSKRHGHTSVEWYQKEGFLPEALLNFLALMGWSHPLEKEVFSLDEFVSLFDPKNLKPVAPIFDLKKLEWINGEYIRKYQISNIKYQVLELNPELKSIEDFTLEKLLIIAQSRVKTLKDFGGLIAPFIVPQALTLSGEEKELKEKIKKDLEGLENWNKDEIAKILIEKYVRGKMTSLKNLYKILIGREQGMPFADTFEVLGKEKALALLS